MSKIVLSSDSSAYQSGDYTVLNNTWGKGSLVNGTDYTESLTFDTSDITHGITFAWSWPTSTTGQIVAYPEILWGDTPLYDGPEEIHTYVSKISDLKTFAVDLDIDVASGSQYYDLSFDLWLTNKPLGDASSIDTEVMIWLDNQTANVWGSKVGTFTDGTHQASVYFHDGGSSADYIAVVFDKPWLDGTIDIKKVLADLGSKGLLSTSDYISGQQFGAEITGGSGSFTINSISTTFEVEQPPTTGTQTGAGSVSTEIRGHWYADTLVGKAGHDVLRGFGGDDTLRGRGGNDVLSGGRGDNILSGGGGADVFVFGRNGGHDRITDFQARGHQHDAIDLSHAAGIDNFNDLIHHHIEDTGSDLVITVTNGARLVLEDVHSIKNLVAADFTF